jgi:hypothetical protein
MCPPGEIFYFVTLNGIPCSNYDKNKIKILKNPIVHTDNLNLYSEHSTENQNDMFYETDSIKNQKNNNNYLIQNKKWHKNIQSLKNIK